jgi:putative membrane protein
MQLRSIALAAVAGLVLTCSGAALAAPPNNSASPNATTTTHSTPAPNPNSSGMNTHNNSGRRTTPRISRSDRKLMMQLAQDSTTEVRLGKIAQQKSSSPDVKQFAEHMITDHTRLNEGLEKFARENGVSLPTSLDKKHQKLVDRLSALNGSAFDSAYRKDQLYDHENDVKKLRADVSNGQIHNAGLRNLVASQVLPTIEHHLDMARRMTGEARGNGTLQGTNPGNNRIQQGNNGASHNGSSNSGTMNGTTTTNHTGTMNGTGTGNTTNHTGTMNGTGTGNTTTNHTNSNNGTNGTTTTTK